MRSKRMILLIGTIIISLILILIYSEYGTKKFVNEFIPKNKDYEEILDRVTIWETKDNSNDSIAIINRDDARLDDVRHALSSWKVKRTIFKDINFEDDYLMDIAFNDSILKIRISQDGYMIVNGYIYEIVSGVTVEELIEIAK